MDPYGTFRATRHFGSLDALRALSILAVIWHHGPGGIAGSAVLQQGLLGVHLFFAISGFLITTLLLREADARGQVSLQAFYARRILRIFPLYYAVLLVYVMLVWLSGPALPRNAQFFDNLPYFVSYTSNWFVGAAPGVIFSFAWSLATEEQFYCTWPVCLRFLPRRAALGLLAVLVIVPSLVRAGMLAAILPPDSIASIVLKSISLPLCLGVALAYAAHTARSFRVLYAVAGSRWASLAVLLALLLSLQLRARIDIAHALMALLVVSCVLREDHVLARPFRSWLVVRIGVVSYGMYLLHGLAYNVVQAGERVASGTESFTRTVPGFVAGAALTYIAAEISFRLFESRFLRLKDRFARIKH